MTVNKRKEATEMSKILTTVLEERKSEAFRLLWHVPQTMGCWERKNSRFRQKRKETLVMFKIFNRNSAQDIEVLREEFGSGKYIEDMDYILYLMSK